MKVRISNLKERKMFENLIKSLTDDELKKELENFEAIEKKNLVEYNEASAKFYENQVDDQLGIIKNEIIDREQRNGQEKLEGTRIVFYIDVLHERKQFSLSRGEVANWISSFSGVKSVRVDDSEAEKITECDLKEIFYDYFEEDE